MKRKFLSMFFVGWLLVLITFLVLMVVRNSYAQQGPTVIIAPNGSVTYVYPGPPAVILSPNGGVSTVYPTTPAMPITPILVPFPLVPFVSTPPMGMP